MLNFKSEISCSNIQSLWNVSFQSSVNFCIRNNYCLSAGSLDCVYSFLSNLLAFCHHTNSKNYITFVLFVVEKHEFNTESVQDLSSSLSDLRVLVGSIVANKVKNVCFSSNFSVLSPCFTIFFGTIDVASFEDLVNCCFMCWKRSYAILNSLNSQCFERETDFEVEVSLTCNVASSAERACIESVNQSRSPVDIAIEETNAQSHFTHCSISIEVIEQVGRTSDVPLHTWIICMFYPVAAFALDAVIHVILEHACIFNIQF